MFRIRQAADFTAILTANVVYKARGVLDLLSGVIALRTSEQHYNREILPLARSIKALFGNKRLLTNRAAAMKVS